MKINFLNFVVLISGLILISSCGKKENLNSLKPRIDGTTNHSKNYLVYPNIHYQCLDSSTFSSIENLTSLISGKVTTLNHQLTTEYSGYPVLKSEGNNFIYASYFGARLKEKIFFILDENNEIVRGTKTEENTPGKSIAYCSMETLQRQSVQHIALNVLATLDQTFNSLEIAKIASNIKPIAVYTHPLFETEYNYISQKTNELVHKESSAMTDNAFYYNNGLYFIPHSQEFIDYLGDAHLNYWEIPFVSSHEYGHHIFATLFPNYYETETLTSALHKNCFSSHKMSLDHVSALASNGQNRAVTTADVTASFNEGFADLIAFYTLDKAHSSLDNVTGFDDEREVDSLFFGDFSKKEFAHYEGMYFFSTNTLGHNHPYSKFQDSHAIGAIVAAQFENFLSNDGLGAIQKLIIITDWVKLLKNNHDVSKKLSPQEYMKKGIEDFVTTYLENTGQNSLSNNQVKAITSGFSYLF